MRSFMEKLHPQDYAILITKRLWRSHFAPPAAPQMQEAHAFLHGLRVVQPRRTWLGQTAYAVSRVELGNLKKKFLRQQGKQP